jgi:hypothetical protein
MGSKSDWEVMSAADELLTELGVPHEVEIVSAHRTPDRMFAHADAAESRGLEVVIAPLREGRSPAGAQDGTSDRLGRNATSRRGPCARGLPRTRGVESFRVWRLPACYGRSALWLSKSTGICATNRDCCT